MSYIDYVFFIQKNISYRSRDRVLQNLYLKSQMGTPCISGQIFFRQNKNMQIYYTYILIWISPYFQSNIFWEYECNSLNSCSFDHSKYSYYNGPYINKKNNFIHKLVSNYFLPLCVLYIFLKNCWICYLKMRCWFK